MKSFLSCTYFKCAVLAFSIISLGACARGVAQKEISMRLASPAWMIKREIPAGPLHLMAFERMHEREAPVTLYIEGDGESNFGRSRAFFNATPVNPVALHLATKDNARNLAYLARPCQYTEEFASKTPATFCGGEYWTGKEYSPEVLMAYNNALDEIKGRYGLTGFNLVGFDSGATIAAKLAATRSDVFSLRTVAGKFDEQTLKPEVPALRYIPQHHFIGGADLVVPPAMIHSYLQALNNNECAQYTLIQEAEHEKGWTEKWPELLKKNTPACIKPAPTFHRIEKPKPIYSPRRLQDMKK